jgi:hypothetical protein
MSNTGATIQLVSRSSNDELTVLCQPLEPICQPLGGYAAEDDDDDDDTGRSGA